MWIDTHCHLDAAEFDADRDEVARHAHAAGVHGIVIPAIARSNFAVVRALAAQTPGGCYALGIHPLFTPHACPEDLLVLRREAEAALDDPRFVGIGEIGLDFFVPGLDADVQKFYYTGQLKIARDLDLPVLLHVRRAQDQVLAGARRFGARGIAHAFNGSRQQADAFVALGFKLGFGGAMTHARALQIRRLAADLPPETLVLETDAPDIAPHWLGRQRNTPGELPRIAEAVCELRGLAPQAVAALTTANAHEALPRLAGALAVSVIPGRGPGTRAGVPGA